MTLDPQKESCSKVTCDLAPSKISMIDLAAIDYQPGVQQPSIDPVEQVAYIHQVMCPPAKIPPTVVRFDHPSGKYLIVPNGREYTDEGFQFQAAKKIGLSGLPCRIVGDDPPPPEVQSPISAPSPDGSAPSAASPTETDRLNLDPVQLNDVFRELLPALGRMASSIRRRTETAALRFSDDEDWCQEALLALWCELKRRGFPRLRSRSEVRNYVFKVLRNQAATAAKKAIRTRALPDGWNTSSRSVLDKLIEAEDARRLDKDVETLQAQMDSVNDALRYALSRLPAPEATAARVWLDGASLEASYTAGGITLAKIRRVIRRLRTGDLAALLHQTRAAQEAIHRVCPSAAARIDLGKLKRLLEDPIDHP